MAVNVKDFDLTKKVEKFDSFLLTKGLRTAPTMRVAANLDISGSMSNIIQRGDLQKALTQLMGPALKFDDNGELDVFKFDDRCEYVGTATEANYADYVRANRIAARGGTSYAPIVTENLRYFFGDGAAKPKTGLLAGLFSKASTVMTDDTPVLCLIVTDGECSDPRETEAALKAAQAYPIYFHFVAVGSASFRTIKHLADALPNVGDVYLRDFGMSDDEVYGQLVSDELVTWIGRR